MEVYLIRHTTPAIEKGICYGQVEVDLNEDLFARELENIRTKIPLSFDAVFSSSLNRCTRLAKELSEDYIADKRLQELSFGLWENKRWNNLPTEELNLWMDDYVNVCVPGGESYVQLSERINSFLNEVLAKDYKTISIITHAGCMRSFLAGLLGLPLENTFRIQLNYGSVIRAEFDKDDRLNKLFSLHA